jgi:hypothetical protein
VLPNFFHQKVTKELKRFASCHTPESQVNRPMSMQGADFRIKTSLRPCTLAGREEAERAKANCFSSTEINLN